MLSKLPQRTNRSARVERLALLVCFAALLAVLAILGIAKAAHAAEAPSPSEPELQLTEEDWELEEDEECLEVEQGEEEVCEEEGEEETEVCPLRSAHAHLAEKHNRVKLTIGYTTNEPTPATIKVQSGGTRTFKRYLNRSGVLRFTENAGTLHKKVVIRIEAVGWTGCPSRRLVLHLPR